MWFHGYRPSDFEEAPLGTAELPEIKKAKVQVPCGQWLEWDEANEHYMEPCLDCDRIHKERKFVDPSMG